MGTVPDPAGSLRALLIKLWLNWLFRQHPGQHDWESTSIHLEDAFSIASQPAIHWGKICPKYLLKPQPSPHSIASPQINPI